MGIGRAVGAVQGHLEPLELHAHRDGALAEFDVAAVGIHHPLGLAQPGRVDGSHGLVQFRLDGVFHLIGQLEALGGEELDAVVIKRVVRGTDDDTGAGTHGTGQVGDGRGGHGTQQVDVDAGGGETGLQGRFEHIAGDAGVLADEDLAAPLPQHPTGGPAQAQDEFRGNGVFAHLAADAVGTEILASQCTAPKSCVFVYRCSRAAATTLSTSRVSATSWTRITCAPCQAARVARARLP